MKRDCGQSTMSLWVEKWGQKDYPNNESAQMLANRQNWVVDIFFSFNLIWKCNVRFGLKKNLDNTKVTDLFQISEYIASWNLMLHSDQFLDQSPSVSIKSAITSHFLYILWYVSLKFAKKINHNELWNKFVNGLFAEHALPPSVWECFYRTEWSKRYK